MPREVRAYECNVCTGLYLIKRKATECEDKPVHEAHPVGTVLHDSELNQYILITKNIIQPYTHETISKNKRVGGSGYAGQGREIPNSFLRMQRTADGNFARRLEKHIVLTEENRDRIPKRLFELAESDGIEVLLAEESYPLESSQL